MKIDVRKVARLANLPLSADEEEKYSKQLSEILDYIDQLNRADTSKVEPQYNVTGLENVTREDEVEPSLPSDGKFFVTKGIFDNE